jgi:hypothetical protein
MASQSKDCEATTAFIESARQWEELAWLKREMERNRNSGAVTESADVDARLNLTCVRSPTLPAK